MTTTETKRDRTPRPKVPAIDHGDMSWMDRGACLDHDPEIFFPGERDRAFDAGKARLVCRSCPVQADCLAYALATRPSGVWAGTTETERKQKRGTT